MDQSTAKKELQELIKTEELKNKICVDCSNPNPQWASLSHAVFLCLQCAGVHRGFGVHISFVRSVSMDSWQEDQIRRMKLGGNAPFIQFMKSYEPADKGGYKADSSAYDKYHSWAASQYREKLTAELEGKPWSPSLPPEDFASPTSSAGAQIGRPSSAQALRKSRVGSRQATGSPLSRDSASPVPSPDLSSSTTMDQKAANENYFANLGSINAARSADLPPSQGGRYQGFGNTPSEPSASHPSFGLSSAAVPSFNEFQENPGAALSKGWSLFSKAVMGASKAVQENVVQPGLEKVNDPDFQSNIRSYVNGAGRTASTIGQSANTWGKSQLGVDVAGQIGGFYDSFKDRVGGGGHVGYGALATEHEDEGSALYHDYESDNFGGFNEKDTSGWTSTTANTASASSSSAATASGSGSNAKKTDDWDEWKDF